MSHPSTMLLADAYSQLSSLGTTDNAKHFKMLYSEGPYSDTTPLAEYIDFILNHTDAWLSAFPESLRSRTALSKPKTAVLKLMSLPDVKTTIGAKRCFDVIDKVSDSYRRLASQMSDERILSAFPAPIKALKSKRASKIDDSSLTSTSSDDENAAVIGPRSSIKPRKTNVAVPGPGSIQASMSPNQRVGILIRILRDLTCLLNDLIDDTV